MADITEILKLVPDDGATSDFFGSSVCIRGTGAIVGAPGADPSSVLNAGAAYLYEYADGAWSEIDPRLLPDDRLMIDAFGTSVSIAGDTAIVGKPFDDNSSGTAAGCVYFYLRSEGSWGDEQKLVELTGDDDDSFGWSVAIYGKTAVIGAYLHDDDAGDDTGSARIAKYYNNFWLPSYLLKASDRAASDSFGYSVSISATTVIVSAFNGDGAVADSGAAYVFKQTSGDDTTPLSVWKQTAKLIASDGAVGDRFGYSASISGQYALVGATQDNSTAGSAYLFDIYAVLALTPAIPGLLLINQE